MKAKWIWFPGDFELYHHLLLSCRRQEHGCDYPCMWHLSAPEKSVCFTKKVNLPCDTVMRAVTHSRGMVRAAGKLWPVNEDIPLPQGEHTVVVELYDIEKFPALYVENPFLATDESWQADARDTVFYPACCEPAFTEPEDDPALFPFLYNPLSPTATEKINGGVLYDFGKETFGPVTVTADDLCGISLTYGESRQEALDYTNAIVRETLKADDDPRRPARAFRFIFVKAPRDVQIKAEYEYLALEDKASFTCNEPLIKDIWDTCAYTFHLNSREFYLDGIKRDRWVWSGDAYQSFMINRCLYDDDGITERTITALLGKPPYKCHINTINDYSAYLIMAVWEHYFHSGNLAFLKRIYPNVKELFNFIVNRLDENGFVARRSGDWIFVDWGDLDKEGPICFEQILLWKVYGIMAKLAGVMGEEDIYSASAETLKDKINKTYWLPEKGAFIDSFVSGKNYVTRQTNVMAVLTGFVDETQKQSIICNVLQNDSLPAIRTPYFKLYELMALCQCGKIEEAQRYITDYWGKMLSLGATTVWEEFDPTKSGDEHLAMYGSAFGKSLCHAWGSGPILLLTAYCAGISSDALAENSFTVKPSPGLYTEFTATAPVKGGTVTVEYRGGTLTVTTDAPGGKLICGDKTYEIEPGKPLSVKYTQNGLD